MYIHAAIVMPIGKLNQKLQYQYTYAADDHESLLPQTNYVKIIILLDQRSARHSFSMRVFNGASITADHFRLNRTMTGSECNHPTRVFIAYISRETHMIRMSHQTHSNKCQSHKPLSSVKNENNIPQHTANIINALRIFSTTCMELQTYPHLS